MKKILLILLLIYGIYVLAWYRGVNHESIKSTIAKGNIELQAVLALRQGEYVDLINVLEKDLIKNYVRISSLKGRVPKEYKESSDGFIALCTEYFKEHDINPSSLNVD